MGFNLSTGVKYAIGTGVGSAIAVTGISNAATAVVSAAAHGLDNKAPVILQSGWEEINDTVHRVSNKTAGTFELEDLDTTDTTLYPAGTGGGTITPITAWTDIPQIVDVSPSGGEPQFIDVRLLSMKYGIKIPDGVSGMAIQFTLAADRKLPAWKTLNAISRASKMVAIRKVNPGGAVSYAYGYFFMSPVEQDRVGDIQKVTAAITTMRPFVSYASA